MLMLAMRWQESPPDSRAPRGPARQPGTVGALTLDFCCQKTHVLTQLLEIDLAGFQRLAEAYLHRRGYDRQERSFAASAVPSTPTTQSFQLIHSRCAQCAIWYQHFASIFAVLPPWSTDRRRGRLVSGAQQKLLTKEEGVCYPLPPG